MRGLAGMVVAAATMLTAVPGASAGTYDVVSCGAPGAGGVNGRGARRTAATSIRRMAIRTSGRIPGPTRSRTSVRPSCWSARRRRRQRAVPHQRQLDLRRAARYPPHAPGDVAVRGQAAHQRRRPATRPGRGSGRIPGRFARDEGAQLIGGVFGENCTARARRHRVLVRERHRRQRRVTRGLRHQRREDLLRRLMRGALGCPRAHHGRHADRDGQGLRHASHGDRQRPAERSGSAARCSRPAGAGRATGVTYDATDNTGIRAVGSTSQDEPSVDARPCDYHLPAPCPGVSKRTIGLTRRACPTGSTPPASWPRTPRATRPSRSAQIRVDGTPPSAVLERTSGRSIVLSVTDAASGVASCDARGSTELD